MFEGRVLETLNPTQRKQTPERLAFRENLPIIHTVTEIQYRNPVAKISLPFSRKRRTVFQPEVSPRRHSLGKRVGLGALGVTELLASGSAVLAGGVQAGGFLHAPFLEHLSNEGILLSTVVIGAGVGLMILGKKLFHSGVSRVHSALKR
ncbi:MAG: hypothetical protein V4437_01370 [Patescibacteria group bacterium]